MKYSVYALCFFLFTLIATSGYAQYPDEIFSIKWAEQPKIHKIEDVYKNESAVILLDKRKIEYVDSKEEIQMFRTMHKIIHLNDDRGIQEFNTIYLPVSNTAELVDVQARTILPDGKMIILSKKDIKELKEADYVYKIFALEGLVKGCEIEFYYVYKANVSFIGKEVVQGKFPVVQSTVEIVSPSRLVFETKSYNNLSQTSDTVLQEKRIVKMLHNNLNGLEEEKYAMHAGNLKRLEYKLSYNKSKNQFEKLFTWNELVKKFYTMHATYSEKDLKRVDKLIDQNGWNKISNDREKLIAVEDYLKKTIALVENISHPDADKLEWIVKNKNYNNSGAIKLYGCILKRLNVPYEFVLCGSRNDYTIDKSFENWNNYSNILLYFPGLDKYMSPTESHVRYPIYNPYWGGANGIHCKTTTIGDFTTAIANIKPVKIDDYINSDSEIKVLARFNENIDTLLLEINESHKGFSAIYFRTAFNYGSPEEQRQAVKDIIKNITNSETIVASNVENREFDSISNNVPINIKATVKSAGLVETAGSKILIKVGQLIGTQTELYQEKPRQSDIELAYPHSLIRTIQLEIPTGYTIKNMKDIEIHKTLKEGDHEILAFHSSGKLEGNKVEILINEAYPKAYYPISAYPDFKDVINASADFNKVILILEKI